MVLNTRNITQLIEIVCEWVISVLSVLVAAICFTVFSMNPTEFTLIAYSIGFTGTGILFCPKFKFPYWAKILITPLLVAVLFL